MNQLKIISAFTVTTFVLTFLLTSSNSILANALSQAAPAVVVLGLILLSRQKMVGFKELGLFNLGNVQWYLIAISLPAAAIVTSYLLATRLGYFSLDLKLPAYTVIYHTFLFMFMWPLLWAMTEEIGWRGFLQPKLINLFGLRPGLFLTGITWAVWHFIFIFPGTYYEEGNLLINTLLFTVTIVLMSFAIGWIRWKSQSLWPCVLFHSASNATWQICSYQFNVKNPYYIYMAGEAGVLNIVFWGVVLIVVWKGLVSSTHKSSDGEYNENLLMKVPHP
ncbi:CAAX amino terminal protease self- immunity [Legionella donaldsonii]|uniref:CAAX amino terminal protease self- immunity n=1 Tax=Legionella donaldsonii TaxID=45060 RepID=A0A378IZR5_9GAMM|nr:CPBP family intramembrane glutamic endopeptidase [Legionella donaldsonii]STX40825.1 CAAX amino terminal protease self- immunity [Legionella donaldsonii]